MVDVLLEQPGAAGVAEGANGASVVDPSPVGKVVPAESDASEQTAADVNGGTAYADSESSSPAANGVANGEPSALVSDEADAAAEGQADQAPVEEEKWRKRLYFVRMPKPPEDTAVIALDQEFESLRAQHNLLSESMKVKKLEKDAAYNNSRNAQAAVNSCIEAMKAKEEQLAPLRELREARKKLIDELSSYKDLPVKSEQELERAIAESNHRIEHESLTLNEEKKEMQMVKKLSASRERVKEYAAKSTQMDELRQQIKTLEQSLEGVEADRRALKSELDVARMVRDKYREEERTIAKAMSDIYTERTTIKEVKDAAYGRMAERKSDSRAKVTDYYENRRFSRRVRELVAAGKVEEARDLCAEQQEEAHAKLNADEAYRTEYLRLWSQQRVPTFDFSASDEPADEESGSKKGSRKSGATTSAADPEVVKRRAEAIIEAALAGIKVKPATATEPVPSAAEPAAEPAPASALFKPSAASALSTKASAGGSKSSGAPLVMVPEASLPAALAEADKFQLPAFAKAAKRPSSSQQQEQGSGKDSRAAAADAEQRKERRRKAAERRREKAVEASKAKEAEQRVAAAEAAAATAEAAEADVSSDEPAAPAAPSRAVAAPAQPAKRGAGAPSKAAAAVRSTARARPPVKKKGIKAFIKQNEMYLIAGVFVLFMLTVFHFSFSR